MHVRRIRLGNFMSHSKTEVDLPQSGVVLVTGNNGAGKSALMEGVSTAIYGQTLRKTSPFHEGEKGLAEIEFDAGSDEPGTDTYRSKLKWTGKTKQHEWRKGGVENSYETNTKSLEALASVVGSFDIWRRTHVFSSSDAASFTAATDAQRKQLLESLLGIDWFDTALKRCRDELKATKPRFEGIQREITALLADIATHHTESAKHKEELASLVEPMTDESLKTRSAELRKLVQATKTEMDQAYAKAHRLQTAGEVEAREAMVLKKKAQEMPDECFTCGQSIPPDLKAKVNQAAADKLKEAKAKRDSGKRDLEEYQEELGDLKADLDALEDKLHLRQDHCEECSYPRQAIG
jgi:exonuclease SbcC